MKKSVLFSIVFFITLFFITNFSNAATTKSVNDEDELKKATEGDVIELSNSISLKSPIEITDKNITINGKGNVLKRDENNWTPSGSNGTLITAGKGAKVELKNLTLQGSQKYGAQAYNGGYIILNGVTISNCGFGGVLVNGGTVEVKNLTLKRNGSPSNNGIEIAQGDAVEKDNKSTVVMNGTLTSTEQENVIYVAEDNPNLKEFEVKNTDNTINKIFIDDNKVVITDDNNKVLYTSKTINNNVEVKGTDYVETPKEDPKKDTNDKKDETPKTGIESNLVFAILTVIASSVIILALKRKEILD